MSKELQPVSPMDFINKGLDEKEKQDANLPNGISFLPNLTIAYATSKAVKEKRVARPGEFVLGGQTALGEEVEMLCLDFRRHACYQKKDYSMNGEIYHFSDAGDVRDNEAYQEFIRNVPEDHKLLDGVDLFLYLVEAQIFCTFFLKKTTAKFSKAIVDAGDGGRVIKLSTQYAEYKGNSWYDLNVVKTGVAAVGSRLEGVDASLMIPVDKFTESLNLWKAPQVIEIAQDEEEDVAR